MGHVVAQHPLNRADGSAVLADDLYTVIAGVNGPVEVSRRDELPEEAAIVVNVRPSSGTGGPRERWLESVVQSLLESVILVDAHPRTLIQVTLQITKQPSQRLKRMTADISVLPTLINAAFLALVDSSLPLASTITAALSTTSDTGDISVQPKEKDLVGCTSIHALVYAGDGEQLLVESAGAFDMGIWEKVAHAARRACLASVATDEGDVAMGNGESEATPWLRQTLQDNAEAATAWRETT